MAMTQDDWASLASCPGWKAFQGYLADARAKLADGVMDGDIAAPAREEAILRFQALKDIAEMDWQTIAKFYGIPLEDNKEPA